MHYLSAVPCWLVLEALCFAGEDGLIGTWCLWAWLEPASCLAGDITETLVIVLCPDASLQVSKPFVFELQSPESL